MQPHIPALALIGVTASMASMAHAHISLDAPKSRYYLTSSSQADQNKLKSSPCGVAGDSRTTNASLITTFKPGETITVTWRETIQHPGHYRIAFDSDGQDFPFPGVDLPSGVTVLADDIADKNSANYTQQVTLPNIECSNCTLQLIQVMTTAAPPYAASGDLYFNCADIVLKASGGASGTGGTTAGIGGTTSSPGGGSAGKSAGIGGSVATTGSVDARGGTASDGTASGGTASGGTSPIPITTSGGILGLGGVSSIASSFAKGGTSTTGGNPAIGQGGSSSAHGGSKLGSGGTPTQGGSSVGVTNGGAVSSSANGGSSSSVGGMTTAQTSSATGGSSVSTVDSAGNDGGCSCRLGQSPSTGQIAAWLGLLVLGLRKRSRRQSRNVY